MQTLCKGFPAELAQYFHYCRSLRFDDKPDYAYLKRLFRDLFIREGEERLHTPALGLPGVHRRLAAVWSVGEGTGVFGGVVSAGRRRGMCRRSSGTRSLYALACVFCSNGFAGYQFDYIFDWTILKYKQAKVAGTTPQRLPVVSRARVHGTRAAHNRSSLRGRLCQDLLWMARASLGAECM